MPVYSHSRIESFFQCPLKFKYNYIEKPKIPLKEGIEAFMGSRVHETMEYLYKLVQNTKVPSEKELIEYYDKQWKENWNENVVVTREGLEPKNYYDLGIKCIKNYYEKNHPFNQGLTIGIEKRILINLNEKYKLQGFIDRLVEKETGCYEIHDYKTYSSLPEQSKLDQDSQLALYAIGLEQEFNDIKSVDLVWHLLVFGKELRSSRTKEELNQLKETTIERIREIESAKDFPAKPSALCNWCAFQCICPEFKHEIETQKLSSNKYLEEEGVVLANKFIELKNKETEIKKELYDLKEAVIIFAKAKGYSVIQGSDGKISIRESETVRLPKKSSKEYKKMEDLLHKINAWNEISCLDQTKVKAFLAKKPNKQIEALLEKSFISVIKVGRK